MSIRSAGGYHTTQDIMALHNAGENEMMNGSLYPACQRMPPLHWAVLLQIKIKYTKNNSVMAFITLEDLYGEIEAIVFPLVYSKYASLLMRTGL